MRTSLAAAVVAASMAAAPSAFALVFAQTGTIGGGYQSTGTPTPTQLTDITNQSYVTGNPGGFTQFNAASVAAANPGFNVTLVDVRFNYSTTLNSSGTVRQTSNTATDVTVAVVSAATPTAGTAPLSASAANQVRAAVANLSVSSTYTALPPNTSVAFPTGATFSNVVVPTVTLSSADSQAFIGGGTFNLGLSTVTGQSNSGAGGNFANSVNTYVGSTVGVIYDYTLTRQAVPEPATIALLGAGLLGLGLVRRRKNG